MKKLFPIFILLPIVLACGLSGKESGNDPAVNRPSAATAHADSTPKQPPANDNTHTATAGKPSLDSLNSAVGKTASQIKLWNNKDVSARLEKLMGAMEYSAMKKFWNTEGPIEKSGDVLMMTGCEQHNCGPNQYVIFMDTAGDNINIVHIINGAWKDWKERGEIKLPHSFADELESMKE